MNRRHYQREMACEAVGEDLSILLTSSAGIDDAIRIIPDALDDSIMLNRALYQRIFFKEKVFPGKNVLTGIVVKYKAQALLSEDKCPCPNGIVTDKLHSYRAAMKKIGIEDRQEPGRWLNNRAENLHQPFRRRERGMGKFRDTQSLQKFISIHASIHNHFNKEPHLNKANTYKLNRIAALTEWCDLTG